METLSVWWLCAAVIVGTGKSIFHFVSVVAYFFLNGFFEMCVCVGAHHRIS